MKDGVLLANAGHFDVEIDKDDLRELSIDKKYMRKNIDGYILQDGRTLNLLADGRLVNLASGDGHPAEIMDMSFALQALSAKYILENHGSMENKVYEVPEDIDKRVAKMELESMGIDIDVLLPEQREYLRMG